MRQRFVRHWMVVGMFAMAAALDGCGAGEDLSSDDEVTATGALTGTFQLDSSCLRNLGGAGQRKIRDAVAIAAAQIRNLGMLDCLRNAVFSYGDAQFPEPIFFGIQQGNTTISCENLGGALGEGGFNFNPPNESFTLDTTGVNNGTPADIAETILHEAAHAHGLMHASTANNNGSVAFTDMFEYPYNIPEQLALCSRSLSRNVSPALPAGGPNGALRRDQMRLEATLAPVGRPAGGPFEIFCPGTLFAEGIQVRSGDLVNAIGLSCRNFGPGIIDTPLSGGSGAFTFNDCADDEVLVGIHGNAGDKIDAVGPVCSKRTDVDAGRLVIFEAQQRGGGGGVAYRRSCPPHMVVRAIKGVVTGFVNELDVECQDLGRLATIDQRFLDFRGGFGGQPVIEKCPGRSALFGLSVQAGSLVDHLAGWCAQVSTACSFGGPACTDDVFGPVHFMASHGGPGGAVAQDFCGTGNVMVGLQIRSGSMIDAIGGICAVSAVGWSNGTNTSTFALPLHGGGGGGFVPLTCATGEFLVGWRVSSGSLVDSVQPICRNFN